MRKPKARAKTSPAKGTKAQARYAYLCHEMQSPLLSLQAGLSLLRSQPFGTAISQQEVIEILNRMETQLSRIKKISQAITMSKKAPDFLSTIKI